MTEEVQKLKTMTHEARSKAVSIIIGPFIGEMFNSIRDRLKIDSIVMPINQFFMLHSIVTRQIEREVENAE